MENLEDIKNYQIISVKKDEIEELIRDYKSSTGSMIYASTCDDMCGGGSSCGNSCGRCGSCSCACTCDND